MSGASFEWSTSGELFAKFEMTTNVLVIVFVIRQIPAREVVCLPLDW